MIAPLTVLVVATAVVLAGWAGVSVARDRAVVLRQLWGGAVVEAALLVQALVLAVRAGSHTTATSGWEIAGYALTQLLVLPAAAAWAFAERTRWSSVVLLVAALTVVFLEYRLVVLWRA